MSSYEETKILKDSRVLIIKNDITEKILCQELYISETLLRNIFNKYFGMPPKKYMQKVKMTKAKTLIRTTNDSITKIANDLGYVNIGKFSAAFKRNFGTAPTQYREINEYKRA